ncbi:hypothetical protein [Amycolatopsis sp. NPDC004079]|uniref:hypothetical protein n=1 Tax=Amycolatopsis sp. NPDC004079 TaxID=3154549 RepID=UPI00339FF543
MNELPRKPKSDGDPGVNERPRPDTAPGVIEQAREAVEARRAAGYPTPHPEALTIVVVEEELYPLLAGTRREQRVPLDELTRLIVREARAPVSGLEIEMLKRAAPTPPAR